MGCGSSLVKYLLFFINLIFALAGVGLVVVGVLYKLDVTEFIDVVPEDLGNLSLIPTLLIVVGSIVAVIAFFGCCGAVRESTCMLTTYAIILLVIFILQIALGVFAFLQLKDSDGNVKTEFRKSMQKTWDDYKTNTIARESVDGIQQRFRCCGVDGPNFWQIDRPASCCESNTSPCLLPFSDGCFNRVYDKFIEAARVIGIVVVSVAAIEIFGAIFALCLSSSIRNQYRRREYS